MSTESLGADADHFQDIIDAAESGSAEGVAAAMGRLDIEVGPEQLAALRADARAAGRFGLLNSMPILRDFLGRGH